MRTHYGLTVNVGVYQGHGHVGHAQGLALTGARENHVFHAGSAQGFGGLFSQHPSDGIAEVGLAAAIRSDDGGDALTVESQLGALAKGFKSLQFDAFEFQQSIALCSGGVVTILNSKEEKVKYLHHTGRVFSSGHPNGLGGGCKSVRGTDAFVGRPVAPEIRPVGRQSIRPARGAHAVGLIIVPPGSRFPEALSGWPTTAGGHVDIHRGGIQ